MHMKPERELSVFDDSLDLNAFLLLLWFIVLFENETGSSVTVSSFLNPQRQQSLLHITGKAAGAAFPLFVCVWAVDSASTEHCNHPVLPAHMSKISQRAEGHPRLNLDGSATNYRLVCEIWVAPPWAGSVGRARCGLGAGARLPRSWQVLTPVPGSSFGCCFLANLWFINLKFLHVTIGKGRIYFPQ